MNVLGLIGRTQPLFDEDVSRFGTQLRELVSGSRFLVIGGAGSIGQAVTREIFKRQPKVLHAVDISENNMVELVRDIRSTLGYIEGDFRTFALDCGSREFEALMNAGDGYDYVLNLSALKHVRSEKDPFTLMRLVEVNVLNTIKTLGMARDKGARKYFCVSTDKAANPVNMMGASKRIMEMFLMRESEAMPLSMARFANVAFSDGSLLLTRADGVADRQFVLFEFGKQLLDRRLAPRHLLGEDLFGLVHLGNRLGLLIGLAPDRPAGLVQRRPDVVGPFDLAKAAA